MKRLLALLLCAGAMLQAQDPWTKENTVMELAYDAALFVDWRQTRSFTCKEGLDQGYYEVNPLLGECPSRSTINVACVGSAVGHYLVSRYLITDETWRRRWQYFTFGVEFGVVGHNYSIGIRTGLF